jgi:GNAT superfamily N-acetyltransferase
MPIKLRPIGRDDNLDLLTALLHRAYAPLGAQGWNYTAVDQSVEVTQRRLQRARGFVAFEPAGRIVGTIAFYPPGARRGSPWLARSDVAMIGQFAVDPPFQSQGIGSQMMDAMENEAWAAGAAELALDTAEPAKMLITWYGRRGYRFIEYAQWEGKRYRSVILSKRPSQKV